MASQAQDSHKSKTRRPQRPGGKSRQSARARLVVETKALRNPDASSSEPQQADHGEKLHDHLASQRPDIISWSKSLSEHQTYPNTHVGSGNRPRSSPPSSLYLTVLSEWFKSDRLTKLENRVKRRTLQALGKLNKSLEEAQMQKERLLQDSRQLHQEKSHTEAENNYFLGYLRKQIDQSRKKHEDLWNQYFQECEEIQRRRQELLFTYAQENKDLQAQLLQGKKTQSHLKQQLQAMKHISLVKERQDVKIQTLQKEKEKIKAETSAKDLEAHLQFLQQKSLLDKQMCELDLWRLGEYNTKEFKNKVQALELKAEKANSKFCYSLCRGNQKLWKELQQLSREYHKLETIKIQLEKWKQQLKEEQWYQEALVRGRRRLRAESADNRNSNQCPKEHGVPKEH